MTHFGAHIDSIFGVMGESAIFTPDGGTAVDVLVIPRQPDEVDEFSQTQFIAGTSVFDLRKSEVAAPLSGDKVTLDGVDYIIQSDPIQSDSDRLIWTLSTRPA